MDRQGPEAPREQSPRPVLRIGARLELRKAHPCGGTSWTVTRTGAGVGLICDRCGRRLLLARDLLERRLRRVHEP